MGDGTYGGLKSSRSMPPVKRGSNAPTRSVSTTCANVRTTRERGQQAATLRTSATAPCCANVARVAAAARGLMSVAKQAAAPCAEDASLRARDCRAPKKRRT